MGVLTFAQIQDRMLDALQANVSTDPAFTSAEIARHINKAYADVWEAEGGALKRLSGGSGATSWTPQPTSTADGILTSVVTDIGEIREMYCSTSSSSTGDVAAGSDTLMEPVDLSQILFLRANQAHMGGYLKSKLYAVTRNFTTTPADVNKVRLDVWPAVSGVYYPIGYIPNFSDIDSATVTTPCTTDLGSYDIAMLAAARMAPLTGRAELAPGIMAEVSQRTAEYLARRQSALMDARQDR